ncbi:putative Dyp peroxidase [Rhizoctonia solani 123E]|uniref:Putative Dyp peroxidase n=1 Tax=Rhizoctonia solani 123E TaxID=1423351 RepID=A0A074RSM0_9AGAM|nr:putative Dyp peroxidase [Rhizoctonia solani 123E]
MPVPKTSPIFFNIAFSKEGIDALGLKHSDLGDKHFRDGQFADATTVLGDPFVKKNGKKLPDWEDRFVELELAHKIHGIILVAGEANSVQQHSKEIIQALAGAASILYYLEGATLLKRVRYIKSGLHATHSCQIIYRITNILDGVIIMGTKGDRKPRPEWALGGSFMVFRKLQQLVPEFHEFLYETGAKGIVVPKDQEAAAKLFGSRLIGRWPSGKCKKINSIDRFV